MGQNRGGRVWQDHDYAGDLHGYAGPHPQFLSGSIGIPFTPVSGGSDHLYNFLTAAGALAAVVALAGGAVVAVLYSRKATATVTATLHPTENGTVLAVRPGVQAQGPFKLKFADGDDGAVVTVTPVYTKEGGGTRTDHDGARCRTAFPLDVEGKTQFVSPGETVTSSRLFRVDPVPEHLLGWFVSLNIASKGVIRHGLNWADEIFVPIAAVTVSRLPPPAPAAETAGDRRRRRQRARSSGSSGSGEPSGSAAPEASTNPIETAGGGDDE